jgi:glucoside 3-dehydrogenase (cytochrome c) hitch-hiker subunit
VPKIRRRADPSAALPRNNPKTSRVRRLPSQGAKEVSVPLTISRRAALKTIGASAGAAAVWPYLSDSSAEAFAAIQSTTAPPMLAFLTTKQYETVDAVAETIIPADDHSPGARAARVADYIDLLLSESDPETQKTWTAGLAALDAASDERFGAPYARLTSAQASSLLDDISRNELAPRSSLEHFFVATKSATIRGYYTSEIGIHRELEYKGNRFLREFVGCTHPEHGYEPTR